MSKELFQWCKDCLDYNDCYRDGGGPNYLDPSCANGPTISDDELERLQYEANAEAAKVSA